ncbi:unnamed protein product [Phytophthora fragariaefolia]|uniref:Unnamed protein product n=1 Tax=Phytophthora fragariaefolia TaxID=1490495 RepID=A0A9W6WY96_9STRA|nr:unnamed protein product [Phytophthora fragariaefolia]
MAFQARWRELKKAGWQSKRSVGFSVDFTYITPGKTKKDIRDEDFFVGEEELMRDPQPAPPAQEPQPGSSENKLPLGPTPFVNPPPHNPPVQFQASASSSPRVLQVISPHNTTFSPGSDGGCSSERSQGSPISRRNLGPDFEGVSDSSGASGVEIESEDADGTNVEYLDLDEDDETKEDSQNDG